MLTRAGVALPGDVVELVVAVEVHLVRRACQVGALPEAVGDIPVAGRGEQRHEPVVVADDAVEHPPRRDATRPADHGRDPVGALLRALLVQLEDDADAAGWHARIDAEQDPHRKLRAFAEWTSVMLSTSKAVIAAAQGATSDPAMVELRQQGDEHRREALRKLLSPMVDSLRQDITEQQALHSAWILTGVDLYLNATEGCGWSDTEYQQWLADLLETQLLGTSVTG